MVDPPFGGAPEQAPRWHLTGTEGCGGGIRVFSVALMFSGYMDIYRRKEGIGGARGGPRGWEARLHPLGAPWNLVVASLVPSRVLQVFCVDIVPKITLAKVSFRLDSV